MRARGGFLRPPQAVQDVAVGEDPQHDVVGGGVVDEGPLGVHEEDVGHPDFLHQPPVEGHALVGGAGEGQPLVLPVVPQIQGHGEVLQGGLGEREDDSISLWIKSRYQDSTCSLPLLY